MKKETKQTEQEFLNSLETFLEQTTRGKVDRTNFENVLRKNDYYHENDIDEINDSIFNTEAESRGFIHSEDIDTEELGAMVATKTKTGKATAFDMWKLEAVIENIGKFTQDEFENWINTK